MSVYARLTSARVASADVPDPVGERMRLEQRLRVVRIDLQARGADVGERVDARLLVAGSRCERERLVAPLERLLLDLGEHRELRQPASTRARARHDSPSGSRIATASRASRRAASPTPANQWKRDRMRVQRPTPSSSPISACSAIAFSIAANASSSSLDDVRGARELLVDAARARRAGGGREVGGSAVVRERLAVRAERHRAARRDQRVLGDDVRRTRRLRVVDDVRRVCAGLEKRLEDLAVQAPSLGDREARPDRVPRELVPVVDVRRARPRAARGAPA